MLERSLTAMLLSLLSCRGLGGSVALTAEATVWSRSDAFQLAAWLSPKTFDSICSCCDKQTIDNMSTLKSSH